MIPSFFVSDLHGSIERYDKLFKKILSEKPELIFFGGDLLPSGSGIFHSMNINYKDFINDYFVFNLKRIQNKLGKDFPVIFLILGNDDPKVEEAAILQNASEGIWTYINERKIEYKNYNIFGYAYVPPTPFRLKDWEKYDVSRFVDPGSVSPEEGTRSIPVNEREVRFSTIKDDLNKLVNNSDMENAVFLFHSPPYQTHLDRAALDGKMIDHVPLDVHVGSIAIKRFIQSKQPLLTLHGHVHESAQLTGSWKDKIGRTLCFSAAHNKKELSLIKFDLEKPTDAIRELI